MKKIFTFIFFISLSISLFAQDSFNNRSTFFTPSVETTFDAVVYPNPVTDGKFFVSSQHGIYSVEVMNVIGQRILKIYFDGFESKQLLVELGNCEKGLYLVKISFGQDKAIIKKLLVK